MKKPIAALIVHAVIYAVLFLALPAITMAAAGNASITYAYLFLYPMLCLIVSFVFGRFSGFIWYYPLIPAVLFIPAMALFFNMSAWIYLIVYVLAVLAGLAIGAYMRHRHEQRLLQDDEE